MKPNQISSESVGDIISNLQSRVITLQNQYINFVSYCTDLIKYHKKNLYYELNSDTNLNNLPQAVCKHLESLEEGYRVATTNLDFSVITNNAHEALNKAQIKVVSIFKKHLSEKEAEIKISSVFSSLSEVICRKLFRKNRKSHSSKSVNPFLIENSGEAKFSNITNDTFIASEKKLYLEKQISDMNIINKQDLEQKKPNQIKNFINKTRFSSTESNKVRSNYVSPVLSPLSKDNLEESYIKTSKPQDFSITKSIGNMCRLLNSLNVIISALEKIPEILPDQKQAIKAFYQTKNDLFRSIQNFISNYKAIINPETNLEADLEKKNYEIKYLTNQLKDLTQGVSNTLTELKQLKAANISLKKTVSTLEAKNENLINKIAFNNSKIEKFEKNNKSLQDCLSLQKNNLKSSKNGKNKCETVVLNKKNKIRDAIAIVRDSSVSITPIKKPLSSFCVEFQGFINIAADAQLEFDNSFVMRNLKGGSIKDKIKICEDILLDRLEIEKTPEYLNLNRKYSVLIAEKNLLEEDIIKLKNNLVKTEAENTDLNKKVYQKTEICKVLEELVNKFKTKKSCTDLKIETIFNISYKSSNQESLLNLNSSIEFYIQENTELNKRLNELEKSTQILKSDNIKLHDHNLTQQKQYSLLEKQYSVSEHHIKTYKQELNNINSLINSIKDSKQLLYNQIQFLELENSKLTEKISHIDHTSNLQYTKAHEKDKKIYEDLIQNLSNSLNIASKENSEVKSELKKLLDCKNALLSQFNIQSQELNEFKIEQERLLQQIKDQSNQISIYQGQIHELNNTQSTLNLGIAENVEKNETLSKEIEEKNSEIEILHKDMLELRFKNSVVSHDSSELFKEEIYKLKVKNISLEQTIQEFKNSQGNCEVHKTLLVPEDTRKVLEKKIKDLETVLIKEKEASQKSFDSFAKQLTGANLETHTLRSKVSELTQKYCPIFTSSEDYKIIIAVSYENNSWYLIENMIENDYTWVDASNLKPINENISFYDLAQLKSFESNSEGPESNLNDSYRQQQKISQKELSKKNDIIKNYEDNIAVLKEKNNRYVRDLEKYEHLRVLIARFRELKPILNSECSAVMEMIISMADLSKKNRSAGNRSSKNVSLTTDKQEFLLIEKSNSVIVLKDPLQSLIVPKKESLVSFCLAKKQLLETMKINTNEIPPEIIAEQYEKDCILNSINKKILSLKYKTACSLKSTKETQTKKALNDLKLKIAAISKEKDFISQKIQHLNEEIANKEAEIHQEKIEFNEKEIRITLENQKLRTDLDEKIKQCEEATKDLEELEKISLGMSDINKTIDKKMEEKASEISNIHDQYYEIALKSDNIQYLQQFLSEVQDKNNKSLQVKEKLQKKYKKLKIFYKGLEHYTGKVNELEKRLKEPSQCLENILDEEEIKKSLENSNEIVNQLKTILSPSLPKLIKNFFNKENVDTDLKTLEYELETLEQDLENIKSSDSSKNLEEIKKILLDRQENHNKNIKKSKEIVENIIEKSKKAKIDLEFLLNENQKAEIEINKLKNKAQSAKLKLSSIIKSKKVEAARQEEYKALLIDKKPKKKAKYHLQRDLNTLSDKKINNMIIQVVSLHEDILKKDTQIIKRTRELIKSEEDSKKIEENIRTLEENINKIKDNVYKQVNEEINKKDKEIEMLKSLLKGNTSEIKHKTHELKTIITQLGIKTSRVKSNKE